MTNTTRRCVTIPAYLIAAASLPLLLALFPLAAIYDAARGNRWATSRALAFFAVYIACEGAGIIASSALWCARFIVPWLDEEAYLRANFRLQCWWAQALLRSATIIFGMALRVAGADEAARGPLLLFARHASTADTVLPAVLVSAPHGIRLRYVMKRELLWDPCLDIVGNRLRNHFIDRDGRDPAGEIEAVARLAEGLGDDEGVMIYPEGTRFSPAKRERALARLAEAEYSELLARARELRNVLPPRFGGAMALLDRNRAADVVVLGHTGFEGVERLSDLLNGSLIGRVIEVRFWRIGRDQIPSEAAAIRTWLLDVWARLDDWIESTRQRNLQRAAARSTACPI